MNTPEFHADDTFKDGPSWHLDPCKPDATIITVKGIEQCTGCGKKITNCKNPIFSFNGVYDSDCGDCPGDYK